RCTVVKNTFCILRSIQILAADFLIADSLLYLLADDGKLSFEEFKAYFADGILTTDELRELFYSIDGRQTKYHLGEYLDVLSALEKLNVAVLKAMDKTKEEYQGSSVLGQFVTRFMLRETSSQLLSLQMSLQCAMEACSSRTGSSEIPEEPKNSSWHEEGYVSRSCCKND
uniref:N-terminal EF-hand calcium binding protein 3 n=1 Tax=Cyprinus carpio TaxID=7962 RepID=A0A8C1KIF6_CYPCA